MPVRVRVEIPFPKLAFGGDKTENLAFYLIESPISYSSSAKSKIKSRKVTGEKVGF
ncbi:MAG: hypothetical protein HXS40_03910 [Theionarchaea archaeon]|nr:hypothetical protein [Theionarchaea archaeon]